MKLRQQPRLISNVGRGVLASTVESSFEILLGDQLSSLLKRDACRPFSVKFFEFKPHVHFGEMTRFVQCVDLMEANPCFSFETEPLEQWIVIFS